ncbi:MAG: ECF-type sigma factor [Candidatus Eiseniibacteriota bacterium]|jgi:RNA polymerase sigma factor (sigma-70 family)
MASRTGLSGFVRRHYDSLHEVAQRLLGRERPGISLEPGDLVHTAYRRVAAGPTLRARDSINLRRLFVWKMRNVLTDRARRVRAAVHGGGTRRVPLEEALREVVAPAVEPCEVASALESLRRVHPWGPRAARLLELRYLCDYTVEEAAAVVGLRRETAQREIRKSLDRLRATLDP